MAASITEKPFLIDFAGNLLAYKLSGTPLSVSGRKAVTKWKIDIFPQRDYGFLISYGDKSFMFTIKSIAAASNEPYYIAYQTDTAALKAELLLKIASNFEISKDFAVTVSDSLELTFTSLHHGGDIVSLSSSDPQAVLTRMSAVSGIERKMKNGYKLFARLDVIGMDNGSIRQSATPHILLSLDSSNRATLPLALLRSYFTQADIPGLDEPFRAYPLQYAVIKYRLAYSDFFDGKVKVIKHSEYRYAVSGKIS
ncbi:hypothetical protein LJC68_07290, partial [Bacteroidales bacterium OttesenSCG-928-B11]|nr:hypothetical protein [Bacteroidales bacterium OttesenSCG-928-B11]